MESTEAKSPSTPVDTAKHIGLARIILKDMGRRPMDQDYEDQMQDALLAMVKCAQPDRYDPARGKFSTYARSSIIHDCKKSRRRAARTTQLERAAVRRRKPVVPDIQREAELRELWNVVESRACPRAARILKMRFIEGKDMQEIATVFGCNRQNIAQYMDRLFTKIRRDFSLSEAFRDT